MTRTPTLDAAARDELARKASFTASALRIVANDAALEGGESPEWFNLGFLREAADVILALLAAAQRGAEDTARLRGLERFACVIETRTSEGYQERFERDSDEEFADWLDFVIANTDANQQDELAARAARSATPTEGDDRQ